MPAVLNLSNEVVKMRAEVKRVKVFLIRKLSRQILALQKKKGSDADLEKLRRRATRLREEIHELKVVPPDTVTKAALQKDINFEKVCRDTGASLTDRATARIATHPQFSKKIQSIKDAIKAFKDERINAIKAEKQVKKNAEKVTLQDKDCINEEVSSKKSNNEDDDEKLEEATADKTTDEQQKRIDSSSHETLNEQTNQCRKDDPITVEDSSGAVRIPEEVIRMRKEVKRTRVAIISKMAEEVAFLKKKKGEESEVKESQERAAEILKDIQALRTLKPDQVTMTALQENVELEKNLQDSQASPVDRAIAHIATHSRFVNKFQKVKEAIREEKIKAAEAEKKKADKLEKMKFKNQEKKLVEESEDEESEDEESADEEYADEESDDDDDDGNDSNDSEEDHDIEDKKPNSVTSKIDESETANNTEPDAFEMPLSKTEVMTQNVQHFPENTLVGPHVQISPEKSSSSPNIQISLEKSLAPLNVKTSEKFLTAPNDQISPEKSLTGSNVKSSPEKSSTGSNVKSSPEKSTTGSNVKSSPEKSSTGSNVKSSPEKSSTVSNVKSSPEKSSTGSNVKSSPEKSSTGSNSKSSLVKSSSGSNVKSSPEKSSTGSNVKSSPEKSSTGSNAKSSSEKPLTLSSTKSENISQIEETKTTSKSQNKQLLPQTKRLEGKKDDEESDLSGEEEGEEEKEYFDDSTEERFHKQSSQSEDSDDDDFFLGKVSKFKKRKSNQTKVVEKKSELLNPDKEGTSKPHNNLGKFESVFCSTLSKSNVTSQKAKHGSQNDGSRPLRFQNQRKGPEGRMKASQYKARDLGSDKKTGTFKPDRQTFKAAGQRQAGPSGAGRGRPQFEHRQNQNPKGPPGRASNPPQQSLHPSWEASRKRKEQQAQITAFQGKKIRFDDDD